MRCHGAWHGSPYTAQVGVLGGGYRPERRDRRWVAARMGSFIVRRRPDTLLYVVEKLGLEPAAAFLESEYLIQPQTTRRLHLLHRDQGGRPVFDTSGEYLGQA